MERQAREFELLKPYLVERWTGGEAEPRAPEREGSGASGDRSPSRILIPVANPLTAEELVRIGAALMDARTGSSPCSASSRSRRACRCPRARRGPARPAGSSSGSSTTPPRDARSTRSSASGAAPPRASSRRPPSWTRT